MFTFRRCVSNSPAAGLLAITFLLTGCSELDSLAERDDEPKPPTPASVSLRHDDEEETPVVVAAPAEPEAVPQPQPIVSLPDIVLPPALIGGVTECTVDGVIFRATECYRTPSGFRLTVYCGSNERDATIVFQPALCKAVGEPSRLDKGALIMDGPHLHQRIELPRGSVIWFQLEPVQPLRETSFATVTIAFESQSTIRSNVEFVDIPVSEVMMPTLPLEEMATVPPRLERMLTLDLSCQTYWKFNDFVGDTILNVESFDPQTRTITGFFRDATDLQMEKSFEGSLAADGMSFEIHTVRGSGILSGGTASISNTNLYLQQQETHVTFHLVRCDLLGTSQDGVEFCARIPPSVAYP